jgi:hypothetical protein
MVAIVELCCSRNIWSKKVPGNILAIANNPTVLTDINMFYPDKCLFVSLLGLTVFCKKEIYSFPQTVGKLPT